MSDPVPPAVAQPEPPYTPPAAPPQYGQYQPQPQPPAAPATGIWAPHPVRALRGIGGATRGLLVAYAALSGLTILVDAWGIASGSATAGAGYVAYEVISALVALVSLPVLLATAVCWMVWQYRAAASLRPAALRRSPGWHVGSWFIPFVSLWFPFQNIADLATGSRAALSSVTRRLWWALWLASQFVMNIATRATWDAHTPEALVGALTTSIVSDLLVIAAACFAWVVVARITDAIDPAR